MNKKHLRLAATVAAIALGASLAGCSSGGSSEDSIIIWYRPGSLPDASVEGVKAQFPDADITLIQTPDVDTKLQAALRSNSGIPDMAVATLPLYASVFDKFLDVNEYGFEDVADEYVEWKVQGQQSDGRQVGIPIDIGPNGFVYRADIFESLGLPSEPDDVTAALSTWEGYEEIAKTVREEQGGYVCDVATSIYLHSMLSEGYALSTDDVQNPEPDLENPINQESFERALTIGQEDLCLGFGAYTQEWAAAVAQDTLVGYIGPAYVNAQLIAAGEPSAGNWRVAQAPAGFSSNFGSNLSVFKATKNPELATEIAIWLTNAENQAAGYETNGLFPSTIASYSMSELTQPEDFFGGQVTAEIFGQIAEQSPVAPRSPLSETQSAVFQEAINDAILSGTDPTEAFEAALKAAQDL
ncbi:extracellular solute-binding protein [Microbacterium sp. NPDC056234]|uniref:ABC transporter substrate-binding protein n=1 Tax=Microbacterium sp. NPDC056234 TaxID=3345757 RepID=UPI0035E0A1E5